MTHHLHLISDSTGGTLDSVVKACLAQFEGVKAEKHYWPLIRSARQMQAVAEGMSRNPGLVLYTLVDPALVEQLEKECTKLSIPTLSILHPVLALMEKFFGQGSLAEPGLQHRLNAEYFSRIEAVDYALYHDDGQRADAALAVADVILVGVSRTSKTPTCVYLANRGIKAANIPYVPGTLFPKLADLKKPLVVALTASAERLSEVRRNRLNQLGEIRTGGYDDIEKVQDELRQARRYYNEQGWPVIDVTRRSVEETAAEIITMLEARRS